MSRVTFHRIRAPEYNQIRSVFYFAERGRGFASQLGGYFGGAMSKGGVTVDCAAEALRQGYGGALSLAGHVAESIN